MLKSYQFGCDSAGQRRIEAVATFTRGFSARQVWAKHAQQSARAERQVEAVARGWIVDPADAALLRGVPCLVAGGLPSAIRGSTPHRDAPSLR
jgi:hypothetical protein